MPSRPYLRPRTNADADFLGFDHPQFGQGARTCTGRNISLLEMGKFLPQIMRHFDVEWASNEDEWKTQAAWLWIQSGLIVRFKWRGYIMQETEKIVEPATSETTDL